MLEIISPRKPEHLGMVRRLCWDYRDFLCALDPATSRIVETFYPVEEYAHLMDRIEAEHAPPEGAIRLALRDGEPIGCGMFHTLEPGIAEIKRVYVTEQARGTGAGCAIMLDLIGQCRADGFERIRMDTGTPLKAAAELYLSLGFRLRDPYYEVPEVAQGHLLFFEMVLAQTQPCAGN